MNPLLPIAQRNLDLVYPTGTRTTLIIELGPIYTREEAFRCPVSLRGFHETLPDIAGADSLQALLLAVDMVHSVLEAFVRRGGKIYYPGTDNVYDLNRFLCPTRRNPA